MTSINVSELLSVVYLQVTDVGVQVRLDNWILGSGDSRQSHDIPDSMDNLDHLPGDQVVTMDILRNALAHLYTGKDS